MSGSRRRNSRVLPAVDVLVPQGLEAYFVHEPQEQNPEWLAYLENRHDPLSFGVPRRVCLQRQEQEPNRRTKEPDVAKNESSDRKQVSAKNNSLASPRKCEEPVSKKKQNGGKAGRKLDLDNMIICNPNWYTKEDRDAILAYNKTKVDPFQYQVDKFDDEE